ncbi:hypothetical protein [Alkalilimnicola ehrlichii]|uniref:hypothetical protein n=1 Tax=Alkalilimnicola ehrlichii TaxID=351052 RepID=UPI003BA34255
MSTEAKKHLRAAYKADPEAFEALIDEYLDHGPVVFDPPAPGENAGRKKQVQDQNLALLLADVRLRAERLGSERKALMEIAEARTSWGGPGHAAGKRWKKKIMSHATAKRHLSRAKELESQDAAFAQDVEFYCWAFDTLGQ